MDPWAGSPSGRPPSAPKSLRGLGASSPREPELHFTGPSADRKATFPKPVRRFVPSSWKEFFQGWRRQQRRPGPQGSLSPYSLGDPREASAPSSLFFGPLKAAVSGGHESDAGVEEEGASGRGEEEEEEEEKVPSGPSVATPKLGKAPPAPASQAGWSAPPPGYQERLAAYESQYGHLKSWPGLLRLLGALELVLGGMAFACTAADLQKDYQWSRLYGGGQWPEGSGYSYYGPMAPFVLGVACLAWLLTVILLALGMTLAYRRLLLRAHWWPLTEFGLNLGLSLLYLAAGLAYARDLNRGGLCFSLLAANPLVAALCRVGGSQVAALLFLFLTTFLYLAGALVCLRMWRHESARRGGALAQPKPAAPLKAAKAMTSSAGAPPPPPPPPGKGPRRVGFSEEEKGTDPAGPNRPIPVGYNPRPHVVPDYVLRYPAIGSREEREKYKAVFCDQFGEYKELLGEVRTALQRFRQLDAALARLPCQPRSPEEQRRLSAMWRDYESKKKDPTFLEKRERCDYLRKKLAHLKGRIQAYDLEAGEGGSSIYF